MVATYLILDALTILLFVGMGTWAALYILPQLNVVDTPNSRSNHVKPVPRGGGVVVMFMVLSFMFISDAPSSLVLGAFLLTVVSFWDDMRTLAPRWRFIAQLAAVCISLTSYKGLVFQGILPFYVDKLAVAVIWLWFINLFNFMDGIDGITANQCITNCLGFILLYITVSDQFNTIPQGVLADSVFIGSAMLGFYIFNRHPAKIFLGDSGSVPLGFLMGYICIVVAARGYPAAALIIPAYYLADASLTITRRILAGKKVWEAHSEHAYQRAVRAGRSHAEVVHYLLLTNLLLVVLAVVSTLNSTAALVCLAVAYAFVLYMMRYLSQPKQGYAAAA